MVYSSIIFKRTRTNKVQMNLTKLDVLNTSSPEDRQRETRSRGFLSYFIILLSYT